MHIKPEDIVDDEMLLDSMSKTRSHIQRVQELLGQVAMLLIERGRKHDESKLEEPERSTFAVMTHKLATCQYGSDEYRSYLDQMKPALDHHYAVNRHHPEHWHGGVRDMSLIDLIEMLCDWKAAGERHTDGSIDRSMTLNRDRFRYGEELDLIFRRTAMELWPEHRESWHCAGCGNGGARYHFCEMCGAGRHDYDRKPDGDSA